MFKKFLVSYFKSLTIKGAQKGQKTMSPRLALAYKIKSTAIVTACSGGVFFGIGIYRNDSRFYDDVMMPIVRLCSPELCHRLAVLGFKYNLFPRQREIDSERLRVKLVNFDLSNPVGIAAGFDKHAEAVNGLHRSGFGFVEIGSITPEPQPGNDKPRVFRLVEDKAIINRYGFNSEGHERVLKRLVNLNEKLVLGVNLGKNKATKVAHEDYVKGIEKFGNVADYFVINVSSPNTPQLRNLQQADHLKALLCKVIEARNGLKIEKHPPIFLKLAPDLDDKEIREIVSVISKKECRVDGLIISNTTIARNRSLKSENKTEAGGLSGAPLTHRSTVLVAKIYQLTKGRVPIIGVGGIFNGQDAYDKITAGSSVVQLYTSLIYHGPPIINKIKKELDHLLEQNGFENVEKARGTKADYFAKQK